jgi:hypothetical protein
MVTLKSLTEIPTEKNESQVTRSAASPSPAHAGSAAKSQRQGKRPTKTPTELEANARQLHAAGTSAGDIAKYLGQYGVTLEQVTGWLAT